MPTVTFKDALRDHRGDRVQNVQSTTRAAAVLKVLDRWLAEPGDDRLWNRIADDGERIGQSREETFSFIIRFALIGVAFYDPEHGIRSSERSWAPRAIEENNKFAEYSDALAAYYHREDAGCLRAEYIDDATVQKRAKLYEDEARNFRQTAKGIEERLPPRQRHSAKRENASERRGFVGLLAGHMSRTLGKRYSAAVAVITDIAFPPGEGQMTTAKEVDDICRSETR